MLSPSGQINKLSVFKRAIQYLISKIQENPTEEDRDTMLKCNLAIAEAVAYTKAIQKEKKEVSEMKKLLAKKTLTTEVSTFKVFLFFFVYEIRVIYIYNTRQHE